MRIVVVAAVGLVIVLIASQIAKAQDGKCDCDKEWSIWSPCYYECVGAQTAYKKRIEKKKSKRVKKLRKPQKPTR
jgi:hypothetical protein